MQKTTQGRIHAHLQRAADLLSFGTNPGNPGDKLKLQTVDQNKPMTLWIQIDDSAMSREQQRKGNRYRRPLEDDTHFETDFKILAYEGPDIENYATQDIPMRGREANLRQGHDKTRPFEHYHLSWTNTRAVSYDDFKLLDRPFIEVTYTPPPPEKMYVYDNSKHGKKILGSKRKR